MYIAMYKIPQYYNTAHISFLLITAMISIMIPPITARIPEVIIIMSSLILT